MFEVCRQILPAGVTRFWELSVGTSSLLYEMRNLRGNLNLDLLTMHDLCPRDKCHAYDFSVLLSARHVTNSVV